MTTIWWTIESYLAQVETGYCSVDAAVLNPCTSSWFDLFNLTHTHTRTHTHTHTQYGVCVTSWDVCLFSFFPCSPFSVDTSWTFAAFAYEPQLTFKLRQKQDEISKCVCACVCACRYDLWLGYYSPAQSRPTNTHSPRYKYFHSAQRHLSEGI